MATRLVLGQSLAIERVGKSILQPSRPVRQNSANADFIEEIRNGTNLVFITAHQDDEIYVAPLLAFAADHARAAILCATGGESGGCLLANAAPLTLREVRTRELHKAAQLIGAEATVFGCRNGTSTAHPDGIAVFESYADSVARWKASGEGAHTPDQVAARWRTECPEFMEELREHIEALTPCIVVTFTKDLGMIGHNEHRAVALVVHNLFSGDPPPDAALYSVVHPDRSREDNVRIHAKHLQEIGGRDYLQVALDAFALYESQFGPIGCPENKDALATFGHFAETMHLRPAEGGTK
ncbi:MAG TPA: hypothetical protein HPP77_04895 [Candidatus Hydrogenedentes bacterium]|nr:hypothetical protein [Candidatus Hydrogenedentota bacterium]